MPSESRKRLSSKKGATVRLELVENYVICFFTVLCFCLIPHSSIDWRSGLSYYYFIDFFFSSIPFHPLLVLPLQREKSPYTINPPENEK